MDKKRFVLVLSLVVLVVLALSLSACANLQSDKREIEKAIGLAKERIVAYRQNDAAFADTLMYFLQNSCVYDTEDGFLIHFNDKNYLYTQSLKESAAEYVFYSDVSAAVKAENIVGQTIYTLGYNKQFDGGCARYTVADSATSEIALKSGDVYLNYATAKSKVSLPQMGWRGDDLWQYQNKFEKFTQISTLVFPKGEYPLFDVVRTDRNDVNYFGIEATVYPADNFGGETYKGYNALWNVRKTWSSKNYVERQTYSGLNFEMRKITLNPQIEELRGIAYLMQIYYCRNINFYNCGYLIPQGAYGEDLKKYSSDCVDCFSSWHDLTFDGCSFENLTYQNEGGAISFRDVYNSGCDNLVFTNNTVVSSPRDEGVALFAGWDKRFHPDDAVLGAGYIRNCLLENNKFVALEAAEGLNPRTMFLTVGYQLSPVYDIKYLNNTFDGYCNSYFLHYCYCHGLTFKGNTVTLRQTGSTNKMSLIYHNDSPEASNILVEDNVFNLLGENFQLNCITITSPYSDAEELTFKNNIVNLPEGRCEKIIAGDATVKDNVFNMNKVGSVYYRTFGDVSGNTYNIDRLEKYVFEFYNANVKHDLVVKKEKINVDVALSNLMIFNGTTVKFNGHSLLSEDVQFDIKKVDKSSYHLCWSSDGITDTVVPITFRRCTFGAYEGHLQIVNGKMHILQIES